MPDTDCTLVIGAGAAGLAVARNLQTLQLPFEVHERYKDLGGLWDYANPDSPIYDSVHFISSSRRSGFPDLPMPADYPDYPNHHQALAYLRNYATHFGLRQHIRFGSEVTRLEPLAQGWNAHFSDGAARHYANVVICTGHNWYPKMPRYPGEFTGATLHSHDYKRPDVLQGQRVLVVGAGNSGCDIAAESATHARHTSLSVRRGYYFIPKHVFGMPADEYAARYGNPPLPMRWQQALSKWLLRRVYGDITRFGMPAPDHRVFETHPVINSLLYYHLSQGQIQVRPDIDRLEGRTVQFKDGCREEYDVIVWATGYRYHYPFIDKALLNWNETYPDLWAHMFVPGRNDLFMVGLYVNDGSFNVPAWYQGRVIAGYLDSRRRSAAGHRRIDQLRNVPAPELNGGVRYVRNERHKVAVRHGEYMKYLASLAKTVGAPIPAAASAMAPRDGRDPSLGPSH